jgi:1-deoxy-D-xylulose-5-phosphate reductoisomerase
MVIASRAVESQPLRSREGAPAAEAPARPRRLSILGATGSIGRSCAQVIAVAPHRFSVVSVAGGRDGGALAKCAIELGAEFAALADPAGYSDLKAGLAGFEIEIAAGPEAVKEAALRDADMVVAAIVGAAGLGPTFAAVAAGRTVALANKETLVCAGEAVMEMALRAGSALLPMDSEHNALFQAIGARDPDTIEKMTITASGGPFREWSTERISAATREEALAHPNWVMGPKVTIDSAGLMNKGLELIEAHHLFGLPPDRLDVVVHPQSIVHGLIAFADGSLIAGMASPDMRTPIAHCLAYPDRIASGVRAPDLAALGRLTFERADLERFPALGLAIEALRAGGGAPTALNGANEIAVSAFLDRRIGFGEIARLVARTLSAMTAAGELGAPADIAEALTIHHIALDRAAGLLA